MRNDKENINEIMERGDMKWKQRAKYNWLQYVDRNKKVNHQRMLLFTKRIVNEECTLIKLR